MKKINGNYSKDIIEKYSKLNSKAKSASQDFESYFVSMLLNSMTKGLYKSSLFGDSGANQIFRGFYFESLSKEIAKKSDFGIEKNVYKEMVNKEIPKDILKQLKDLKENNYGYTKIKPSKSQIMSKIERVVDTVCDKYGVDKSIVMGIINTESAFNPMAKSRVGAKGLMQLMDSTARELGVKNVWSIEDNIEGGVKYFKFLKDSLGDDKLALAAYNAGIGNVKKYGGIPPFKETQNYVNRVLKFKENYK